ncbi:MAG: hypothetical protein ACP5QA_09485 [Phycisphaerae bacterium]
MSGRETAPNPSIFAALCRALPQRISLIRVIYCAALIIAASSVGTAKASTTISWNFSAASGALPSSESYLGNITSGPALSGNPDLTILATGYESQKIGTNKAQISSADLYGESLTGTINGLGLNYATLPYPLGSNIQTNNQVFKYAVKVKKTTTTYLGFIQLDLTALITLAAQAGSPDTATIVIAGTSGSDNAILADTAQAGAIGKLFQTINVPAAGGTATATFSLTNFTAKKHFLTLRAGAGEILLNQITLTIPSTASAVTLPTTLSLVFTGTAAIGLLLQHRRRRAMTNDQ